MQTNHRARAVTGDQPVSPMIRVYPEPTLVGEETRGRQPTETAKKTFINGAARDACRDTRRECNSAADQSVRCRLEGGLGAP